MFVIWMCLGLHPYLQMRMGGVWNREMARRHPSSGPQIGRILPWSQTVTFLDTSSPQVSEAAKPHSFMDDSLNRTLTLWPSLMSAFQRSSWATRSWATGRTFLSPSEWTGGTLASLQRILCLKALAWEYPCPWLLRATPTLARLLWSTSSGETLPTHSVNLGLTS